MSHSLSARGSLRIQSDGCDRICVRLADPGMGEVKSGRSDGDQYHGVVAKAIDEPFETSDRIDLNARSRASGPAITRQ